MKRLSSIVVLLLLPLAAVAQDTPAESPGELTVALDRSTARVGDQLTATITARFAAATVGPPRFPVWEEHWGDAEVLTVGQPRDQDGAWIQELLVTVFQTGPVTLPAVEVQVSTHRETVSLRSEPLILEVESVLPATDEEPTPQPAEPPRRMPVGSAFWWVVSVLAVACGILGWLLWRAAKRVQEALAALALSPIEALERALRRLRGETDPRGRITTLCLEFRRYLGRAVGFPAAEGTTTEIQRQLRRRDVPPELVRGTLDLLQEADRIKFARAAVEATRADERLGEVADLARGVETWLRPEPAVEAAEEDAA